METFPVRRTREIFLGSSCFLILTFLKSLMMFHIEVKSLRQSNIVTRNSSCLYLVDKLVQFQNIEELAGFAIRLSVSFFKVLKSLMMFHICEFMNSRAHVSRKYCNWSCQYLVDEVSFRTFFLSSDEVFFFPFFVISLPEK